MTEGYGIVEGKIIPSETNPPILLFTAPDEAEKRRLVEEFGIGSHNLESALDPDELGRMETEKDHFAVIVKTPRNYTAEDKLLFTVTSIGIFLYAKRILLVTTDPIDLFEGKQPFKIRNARDVFLKVLGTVIYHFLGHLKVINMLSESLEKRINASMENRYLLNMFTLEKSLVYFVNGIGSNRFVMDKIKASADKMKLTLAQKEILDDITIENQQCQTQAQIYSDILTGLMDARGSIINNNMNISIKRLTILSVVFMPLNVIAGMGGMSEFSGWTQGIPWWISYPLFGASLVPVAFLTYWILKKTGLDRSEGPKELREP
jgi:magnesium transporter